MNPANRVVVFSAFVLVVLLASTQLAHGQAVGVNARLSGVVVDETGGVIPDTAIRVEEIDTGAGRATITNDVGYFSIEELPRGTYKLTARAPGFGDTVVSPIELQIKQRVSLTVTLKPGLVVETVEVTGSSLRLESQTSDIGQVVTNKSVKQLPTSLRNPMELVGLAPGVTNTFVRGVGGGFYGSGQGSMAGLEFWSTNNFSVAGGHRMNAVIMVDGIDVRRDVFGGAGQSIILTPDFIEEFKVQVNNYSAEYGQGVGVVNMVTKSGTNGLHGAVYDYLQNDNLNANDFFHNARGLPQAEQKRNQYGFVVGGPVYIPGVYDGRNKTWFITDFEQLRQRAPFQELARMPTTAEETGDFSGVFTRQGTEHIIYNPFDTFSDPDTGNTLRRPFANNQIPASLRDPSGFVDNLIPFWPEPNRPGGERGPGGLPTQENNWIKSAGSAFNHTRFDFKLDQQFGERHRVSWRWGSNEQIQPFVDLYGNIASPERGGEVQQASEWQATHTWTVTPSLVVNQAFWYHWDQLGDLDLPSEGYDPTPLGGPFEDPGIVEAARKFNQGTSFPGIGITGYGTLGWGVGSTSISGRKFQYALGVSQIMGKHELKYGAQLKPRYVDEPFRTLQLHVGIYNFGGGFTKGPNPLLPSPNTGNPFADLTLGSISGGEFSIFPENHPIVEQYAWYFEDTWRITPRLTLNLGLRYDFSMPVREVNNRNAKFDPFIANPVGEMTGPNTNGQTLNDFFGRPLLGGIVFAGRPENDGKKRITETDFSNLAPRLGAAFKLNDKTVLRGGVGKLYWMTTYRALASRGANPFAATTPIVGTFDGVHPALEITNVFPNGIAEPTGATRGLLHNIGKAQGSGVGGQKNPYSWQWNFSIQRELPSNSLVTVAYLGSIGRRLPCAFFFCGSGVGEDVLERLGPALLESVPNPFYRIVDPNGVLDTSAPLFNFPFVQRNQLEQEWPHYFFGTPLVFPPPASNSGFGIFTEEYPFKNSWHGLTLGYEKRYSDGLQLAVALTAGKNLTNTDSFEGGVWGRLFSTKTPEI